MVMKNITLCVLAGVAIHRTAVADPETELGFHFGLVQPTLMRGFNAAVELRHERWIATYSHGQGLEASKIAGTLTDAEDAADMRLMLRYSTGGGVGYRLWRDLYVLADVKLHHYEAYAGAGLAEYSTVTVGGELGWRFMVWRGLHVTPVLRFWPNVWDSGDVMVPTANGDVLRHEPAKQGVGGVFANVLVGWTFDVAGGR
jgi:hypothetical protein